MRDIEFCFDNPQHFAFYLLFTLFIFFSWSLLWLKHYSEADIFLAPHEEQNCLSFLDNRLIKLLEIRNKGKANHFENF